MPRVLIACEFSGIVREEFRKAGCDAWSCDLLPTEIEGQHIQDDVLKHLNDGWDLMIAFPPCTHLCSSGARWFEAKRKDGRQKQGVDFFMSLANAPIERVCIENPVGIMSSVWRKPDCIVQPHEHGHAETKATCLWLKNLPVLSPSNSVEPDFMRRSDGSYYTDAKGKRYSRIHFMSGRMKDSERWRERSRTYSGIAKAFAEQWSPLLLNPLPL